LAPIFLLAEPAGHARHVALLAAAVAVLYFPTPHLTHSELPTTVLYDPALHAVQFSPLAPVKPGLQEQSTMASLPSGAFELKGQPRQEAAADWAAA